MSENPTPFGGSSLILAGHDENELTEVYTPTEEEQYIIKKAMSSYQVGESNLNSPIKAFSNKSPIHVYEECLDILNMFREDIVQTVEDSWKTDTRRPIARNKLVAIVAHEINQMIIPSVKAQTRDDESDEVAAMAMKDLLDYVRHKVRYSREMMFILMDAMTSPATFTEVGYAIAHKIERAKREDGTVDVRKVVDEVVSGFYMNMMRVDQVLVANRDIKSLDEQEFIIRRKMISIDTAYSKYGSDKNIKHVKAGSYYSVNSKGEFEYNTGDSRIQQGMVEEVRFQHRLEDLDVVLLNGVPVYYHEDGIQRLDKKFGVAKIGYEPITSEAQFYSYPFILKIMEDQHLLEDMYNLTMDGTKLAVFPPTATNREFGGSLAVPGLNAVVDDGFESNPIFSSQGVPLGFNAIQQIEAGFEQVSPSSRSGIKAPGEQTRREVELLDSNANVMQAIFRAQEKEFVTDITNLFISDIQQYVTMDALQKIVRNGDKVQSIIIPRSESGDALKDREIKFVNPLASTMETDLQRARRLKKREKNSNRKIMEINPVIFLDIDFSAYVSPEQVRGSNKAQEAADRKEMFMLLRDNPIINQAELITTYVSTVVPYNVDKLIKTQEQIQQEQQAQAQAQAQAQGITRVGGADNAPTGPSGGIPQI